MMVALADHDSVERPVLEAALRAFSEYGYHGASTRLIARYAEMSPAALYIHFPTKGEVLGALVMAGLESLTHELRLAVAATVGGPAERLRALVDAYVRWHAATAPWARVIQYESRHLSDKWQVEYRRARREAQALFIEEIRQGKAIGIFRAEDERLSAIAILSMGIDIARWYPDRPVGTPEALGAHYAEYAMRIVTGAAQSLPPSAA
jgi:AcrR family transcriptional regulator